MQMMVFLEVFMFRVYQNPMLITTHFGDNWKALISLAYFHSLIIHAA